MSSTRITPEGPPRTEVHAFEGLPPFATIRFTDNGGLGEVILEVWQPATLTEMAQAIADASWELSQAMARLNA